jgi:hypothetical protein
MALVGLQGYETRKREVLANDCGLFLLGRLLLDCFATLAMTAYLGYNGVMLLVSLVGWWYSAGFLVRLRALSLALGRTADTFSIGLMLRTLFSPFRQIDAGVVGRGPAEAFQALLSRFVSRLVGFVMRTGMVLFGSLVLLVQLVVSFAIALLHLVVPVLPVVGAVAMVVGWVPEVRWW